ncbi:tetratricopeptide repeat protein [Mesoterricola sediminis]|uniref:Tetratricopeptide repeat protein n=1 Tax=Mesoterricola sediminis TaxID=2927980 RepID=A0AA48GQY9_9BACT|nr:tetratricopeptide repeat protein [Mesoterricola sediminis]BDU75957.1 hypothetical protein METESE_09150 [Mesoterricola sediminis]
MAGPLPPSHGGDPCAEGVARFQAGDAEGAAACFLRAARERPGEGHPRYLLGLLHFKKGRYREAEAQLRASAALETREDGLIKLALARGEQKDLPGCLALLEEAARRLPASAAIRAHLATTLRSLDRVPEAIAAYAGALALDPGHVPAHWGLGLALGMEGRFAEGMAALRQAIALDPGFPPPHFHLGVLAWAAGDAAEARAQAACLRSLAPSYASRLDQLMQEESPHEPA